VASEQNSDTAHDHDGTIPPNGWEIPQSEQRQRPPELDALARALAQLLEAIPEDLQAAAAEAARATADAVRALLEAIRAVIDWLAAFLERNRSGAESAGPQVHDIPIL